MQRWLGPSVIETIHCRFKSQEYGNKGSVLFANKQAHHDVCVVAQVKVGQGSQATQNDGFSVVAGSSLHLGLKKTQVPVSATGTVRAR